MLQIKELKPVEEVKEVKRWPYVKHSFPNGKESYWIGWKIHPDDEKFFPANKGIYIRFDKELDHLGNENIAAMNEFKVTRKSYVYRIEDICDALNFFETMYDKEGELITALFEIKCLIDINEFYYPLKSYKAFVKKVYDTIFTPTMLEKISFMVEENYADDIEIDDDNSKDVSQLTVIQQKKRSLAFTNDQVKAMLEVSFCCKILAFIVNHFLVMRSVNVQKNLDYFYNAFKPAFDMFEHDFNVYNKIYAYVESKIAMKVSYNKTIFQQLEIEGNDLATITAQILRQNVITDSFVKFSFPQHWDKKKEGPRERVMSFICSIVNRQGDNFRRQMFRRNLVEAAIIQDNDGNSKSDRYRAYKSKLNEEHVTTCTMDMHQLVNKLFDKYKDEITPDEIMYYRHHLEPSRLHQLLMEIYFFNYTTSAQEFSLLRSADWYKMLLIMKHDIMHRLNIRPEQLVESAEDNLLLLIMTANIEEITVGEKMYIKNTKYLNEHKDYQKLVELFYSTIVSMNEDIIKKFLINFANSNYTFVLYENKELLGKDIIVDKYQLIDELLDFLVISNTNMDLSDDYMKGLCD